MSDHVPHEPETQTASTSTSTGPTRRRLLAGAAWSAPAVVVATAAPALAASTGSAPSITSTTTVLTNGGRVTHTVTLVNSGAQATTGLLVRCVLTYSGLAAAAYDFGQFDSSVSEGWALQGDGKASGKTLDLTFLRTGTQLTGNGMLQLVFLCVQPAPPIGTTATTPLPTPGTATGSTGVWA